MYQCLSVKLALHDLTLTREQSLLVYVVLQRLDVEKETIELVHTKPTETHELPYRIPTDSPRYHFFIFKHSHQGQMQEALGQYIHTITSPPCLVTLCEIPTPGFKLHQSVLIGIL